MLFAAAAFVVAVSAHQSRAQGLGFYDTAPAWPLCGRITENPPLGWTEGDDCPPERFGNALFNDAPLSSTYGPRQLPSGNFRYDFHRGIDIPTAFGTPMFAFADGEVRKAGVDPGFDDPVIEIRHLRPGFVSCAAGGGCYSSMYLHASDWVVMPGQPVVKGQYIGKTGESSLTGFDHLHFEIRDAPPADPFSSSQKECVHPLGTLPYGDADAANLQVSIDSVDVVNPLNPLVTATVTIPMSVELDLARIETALYERQPGGALVPIPQPNDAGVGTTVEGGPYFVDPSFYALETTNRQFTYKDGATVTYDSFRTAGMYESPYHLLIPPSYDPAFHMDAADPMDFQVGLFNGVRIAPIHYNANSAEYRLTVEFLALVGIADAAKLCVQVRAVDAAGHPTAWESFNCPVNSCPPVPDVDCRSATKSKLVMKKRDGLLSGVKWRLGGGDETALADFLDPVGSTSATWSLCIWEAGGGAPIFGADFPAGTICSGKPCWRAAGSAGFRYKDKAGTGGGITVAKLIAGGPGATKLRVGGKGANLSDVSLPLALPVTVQLIADDGTDRECWQSMFTNAGKSSADQVKLRTP